MYKYQNFGKNELYMNVVALRSFLPQHLEAILAPWDSAVNRKTKSVILM